MDIEKINDQEIPSFSFVPTDKSASKTNKQNHYVDNDLLRTELVKSNILGRLTNLAFDMLMLMITEIHSSFSYVNAADKEDCQSNAIEIVLNNWHKYKIELENPFAYFTRVIYNAIYAGWNTIKQKSKQTISISHIFTDSI